MTTPICDFVRKYAAQNSLRLHMPGHKGTAFLGFEHMDVTEIDGADSLYEADGIIAESEANASALFGCDTFYSAEGSSQCIRAMLYLACMSGEKKEKPLVLAARNAHKTFLSAAALLDIDIGWLYGENRGAYLSCDVTTQYLERAIVTSDRKPAAVYITSPDYLGNIADIKSLAEVCHRHGVLLLVDNAHGAYLRFLSQTQHPIDLGADVCCDSAHKTLPVLTGGAYLHISPRVSEKLSHMAKNALAMFGSTSPSYIIMQSLDMANKYITGASTALTEKYSPSKSGNISFSKETKTTSGKAITLTYKEYLKIFIMLNTLSDEKEKAMLSRIATLIQINMTNGMDNIVIDDTEYEKNGDFNITEAYTMLEVEADAKINTWFMGMFVPDYNMNADGSTSYEYNYSDIASKEKKISYKGVLSY